MPTVFFAGAAAPSAFVAEVRERLASAGTLVGEDSPPAATSPEDHLKKLLVQTKTCDCYVALLDGPEASFSAGLLAAQIRDRGAPSLALCVGAEPSWCTRAVFGTVARVDAAAAALDQVDAFLAGVDDAKRGARPPAASLFDDPNFPFDAEKRVHHLSVRYGEVANRVISVGDAARARRIATMLDAHPAPFWKSSHRPGAFETCTGCFNGVPVSIVATGMGVPNMDFVVRELRAVVSGPMAMIRFGTCGVLAKNVAQGSICVSTQGSVMIRRSPEGVREGDVAAAYPLSQPIPADAVLAGALKDHLVQHLPADKVAEGLNCSADSFYSSQGRFNPQYFNDNNKDLFDVLAKKNPDIATMEMETYHLLDLASLSHPAKRIRAAACVICVAHRIHNKVIDGPTVRDLETRGGKAVLGALAGFSFDKEDGEVMSGPECVWAA